MELDARIFVGGHRGLVGSAILRRLQELGHRNLLTQSRQELDLLDQRAVENWFARERPEYVFMAAAKVGGIAANAAAGGDFIRENLLIQTHTLDAAYRHEAKKFVFLGSSCVYPKMAKQPIHEEELLSGPLELTNKPYAAAKIAGIVMAQAYRRQYGFNAICLMPTNLYGPGDNFDLETSHVLPALMRKFHEAKMNGASEVVVWGSGRPHREFLHVEDMADASVFLAKNYNSAEISNVGVGEDVTIRELAELFASVVGFEGTLVFDSSRPAGTPRKLVDVSRLQGLGWSPRFSLREGVESTYSWYQSQLE